MNPTLLNILKKYPFLRLLAAFISGILLQWNFNPGITYVIVFGAIVLLLFWVLYFLKTSYSFILRWLQGILFMLVFACAGAALTWQQNIHNSSLYFGNYYEPGSPVSVVLQEPLTEKANSYKAIATVKTVLKDGNWIATDGDVLLYFKKDSLPAGLKYGSRLLIKKKWQPIQNSGNPGAFDYARYCLFKNITHQVFLSDADYELLHGEDINPVSSMLFNIQQATVNAIRENIPGEKEQGVAEALLIGYREDLDRDLVQAYSNTGIVHIIAISGLHLGMIYVLMIWIFARMRKNLFTAILKPVSILVVLWLFTLVAGAVPSVLRSAVMFTFIIAGECMGRKGHIYNTLAASAFCMLAFNPFMLWDAGFLLSYAAVIGIITFMKPVYNWLYFKNEILDKIWQLCSVTISAQIFTLPIVIYYFHQFPTVFLITNFIAVPFSCIILYAELLLVLLSFCGVPVQWLGSITGYGVKALNVFVEHIDKLPFTVIDGLYINIWQTTILFICLITGAYWLLRKSAVAKWLCFLAFTIFYISARVYTVQTALQKKLIVYNIPKATAIDIIDGNDYLFFGNSGLLEDGFLRNFHLKPGRIQQQLPVQPAHYFLSNQNLFLKAGGKSILLLCEPIAPQTDSAKRIKTDIVIISNNPKIYMEDLLSSIEFTEIIFDSSNPLWKTEKWKKDCIRLHLRFHSVPQDGAFVMNL